MSYIKGTHLERLIDRTFDNLAKRFGDTQPAPVEVKSTTTKTDDEFSKKTKTTTKCLDGPDTTS